eukprot:s4365_g1.t2
MRYVGELIQWIGLVLVSGEPGELFLTQVCHHGRKPARLYSLELTNSSDADNIFKECLAFHVLEAGHSTVLGSGGSRRWKQDDDHDEFSDVWPGKFVKWGAPASGSLAFQNGLRMVPASKPFRDAFKIFERLNPLVPWMPLEMLPFNHPLARPWFRTEPEEVLCSPALEILLHHSGRTLPLVPYEVVDLVSSLVNPLSLLEGMNAFMKGMASGRKEMWCRVPMSDLRKVLVSYQAGQPNLDLLESLYVTVFLQGIWVLLDGQLWPIIAADFVKLNELHHPAKLGHASWQRCPCVVTPELGQSIAQRSNVGPWNVALIGGHNYVFDIALGLREASMALSIPANLNLLGYELAEKFAASAEYCELLGAGFCLRDGNVKHLIRVLSEPNHGLEKHHSTLLSSSDSLLKANASGLDLAAAQEEARRAYLQSPALQGADFIVCTFPYVLAYLLDEVPELRQSVLLIWQGGSLLEYLHEDLHEWAQRKLLHWRTRRLYVMNHLDHHWLRRTVGSVPFAPFGARHMHGVLERQLGKVYGSNSISKQVLVHRMHFILSQTEFTLLKTLMEHHFESKVSDIDLKLHWPPFEIWELINFKASGSALRKVPDSSFMSVVVWCYMVNPALQHVHRFTTIRKEWWHGASCHLQPSPEECAGAEPDSVPPWLDSESEMPLFKQINSWWQETDYVKMPHVQHFTGVVHLLQQLHHFDPHSVVKRMRAANLADKMKSASIYEAMLGTRWSSKVETYAQEKERMRARVNQLVDEVLQEERLEICEDPEATGDVAEQLQAELAESRYKAALHRQQKFQEERRSEPLKKELSMTQWVSRALWEERCGSKTMEEILPPQELLAEQLIWWRNRLHEVEKQRSTVNHRMRSQSPRMSKTRNQRHRLGPSCTALLPGDEREEVHVTSQGEISPGAFSPSLECDKVSHCGISSVTTAGPHLPSSPSLGLQAG